MDTLSFPSYSSENTQIESDAASDCSSSTEGVAADSEVELILASQNPKKRAGRKKVNETRHPVYRGVRLRSSGKWICEVREPNKKSRIWLGTYPTAEMAARAHDVAVLAMRGRSACLNFSDSIWRLPVPDSSNVKDIKKTAAMAAKAFGQTLVNSVEIVEKEEVPEIVFFVDDEEMFGMPEYFDSMAEGLMVPPPQMMEYDHFVDDGEFCADMSLWSF